MRYTLLVLLRIFLLLLGLIVLEGLSTMGVAFEFERYTPVTYVFQSLIVLSIILSCILYTDKK